MDPGVKRGIQRLVELLLDEVERVMDIGWDGHEFHPARRGGAARGGTATSD
jgi:hypothetical protein